MDLERAPHDPIKLARKERERLREAERRAHEVLALVVGKTPATGATSLPSDPRGGFDARVSR